MRTINLLTAYIMKVCEVFILFWFTFSILKSGFKLNSLKYIDMVKHDVGTFGSSDYGGGLIV